jgi:hypothetical protein
VIVESIILPIILAGFCLSIRLVQIRKVPKGIDAQFHLLATSKYDNHRIPKNFGKSIVGDNYSCPVLLHFLLSFIPEDIRPKMLFILDITSDLGIALITYYVATLFMPITYALVAGLVYSVTPIVYVEAVSETDRPLGLLWYTLSMFLLFQRGIFYLLLAAITISLTFLSHKLSTQTLVFVCLIMAPFLYATNNCFPFALMLGFALAFLLTKGFYLEMLRDHIRVISLHMKHGSWNRRKKTFGSPKHLIKFQPFFILPVIGLLFFPQVILDRLFIYVVWYVSVLIIFFVWYWGDNHRYLSYSAVPTSILSAYALYAGMNPLLVIPCLIVSALVIRANILDSRRPLVLPDFAKLNLPDNAITLIYPTAISYLIARHLNGRFVYIGGSAAALKFEIETLPKIMLDNPEWLLDEYHVTHVLVGPSNHDFMSAFKSKFEKVVETNGYILFVKE